MEYVTSEGIIVTNRIFVGSIPDWMCENKLHLAFQDLNFNVLDTRIVVDMKTGHRKGYGFVTFYNPSDAVNLVRQGFIVTKDGVRLKIDTAVRKKGLQLRLQRQSEFLQSAVNQYTLNNAVNNGVYPTQAVQAQMQYVYPGMCGYPTTSHPMTSYQPTYQSQHINMWQSQGIMPYTLC